MLNVISHNYVEYMLTFCEIFDREVIRWCVQYVKMKRSRRDRIPVFPLPGSPRAPLYARRASHASVFYRYLMDRSIQQGYYEQCSVSFKAVTFCPASVSQCGAEASAFSG